MASQTSSDAGCTDNINIYVIKDIYPDNLHNIRVTCKPQKYKHDNPKHVALIHTMHYIK